MVTILDDDDDDDGDGDGDGDDDDLTIWRSGLATQSLKVRSTIMEGLAEN